MSKKPDLPPEVQQALKAELLLDHLRGTINAANELMSWAIDITRFAQAPYSGVMMSGVVPDFNIADAKDRAKFLEAQRQLCHKISAAHKAGMAKFTPDLMTDLTPETILAMSEKLATDLAASMGFFTNFILESSIALSGSNPIIASNAQYNKQVKDIRAATESGIDSAVRDQFEEFAKQANARIGEVPEMLEKIAEKVLGGKSDEQTL